MTGHDLGCLLFLVYVDSATNDSCKMLDQGHIAFACLPTGAR